MSDIRFTTERREDGVLALFCSGRLMEHILCATVEEVDAFERMVSTHEGVCDALAEMIETFSGYQGMELKSAREWLARARPERDGK